MEIPQAYSVILKVWVIQMLSSDCIRTWSLLDEKSMNFIFIPDLIYTMMVVARGAAPSTLSMVVTFLMPRSTTHTFTFNSLSIQGNAPT